MGWPAVGEVLLSLAVGRAARRANVDHLARFMADIPEFLMEMLMTTARPDLVSLAAALTKYGEQFYMNGIDSDAGETLCAAVLDRFPAFGLAAT